jgi:hypothetical protein
MAIIGVERLIQWLYDSKLPYWVAYDTDRGSETNRRQIANNFDVVDSTTDDAARRFRSFADLYTVDGIRCYIWAKKTPGATNSGVFTWFEMFPGNQEKLSNKPVAGISGMGGADIKSMVEEEVRKGIDDYKKQMRIDQLEKEVLELKAEVKNNEGGALERVVARAEPYLAPHIGAIISSIFGAKSVPIQGTEVTDTNPDEDPQKVAEDAITILAADDPQLHIKLKKFAAMKQNDPETWKTVTAMLDNYGN